MSDPATSDLRHSAMPIWANFVAEYAPIYGTPRLPTIDEVTATLPPEGGERGAGRIERAEVVDVHQLPHLVRADVVDRAVDAEAGIAHHHVEPAEAFHRPFDEARHRRFAGDVGDERQRLAACRRDLAREGLKPVGA